MKQKKQQHISYRWDSVGAGYESNRSARIIIQAIEKLKSSHNAIFFSAHNYQSGPSVLLDNINNELLIDKPRDWPINLKKSRLVFRDESKLVHHFNVHITRVTSDTVYTTVPTELFRLQRRKHYRVDAPQGSSASFVLMGNEHQGFTVKDISAGGMLILSKKQAPIDQLDVLEISLKFPETGQADDALGGHHYLAVKKGTVVRCNRDNDMGCYCFGVAFHLDSKEEDNMVKFVRRREIQLLSKGVSA